GGCGATSSARRRRSRSDPTHCSWPSTRAPNLAVSARWPGGGPPTFSTCSPSFAVARTGCRRPPVPAWLVHLLILDLTALAPKRKTNYVPLFCAAVLGPNKSAQQFSNTAESDVIALARLLPAMLPGIDLPRALLRGRYMAAATTMEFNGVPIEVPTLEL